MSGILFYLKLSFIGISALAMVAQTRFVLGLPLSLSYLDAFIFGGALFGYHCTHADWRYRAVAWGSGFLGAICFLFWVKSWAAFMIAVVPVFFWLAYYGFRRPGQAGLRRVLLAKPLTVALAWAWVTVLLPLPADIWLQAWPMFLVRAVFIFALALAYDLSDISYDHSAGFTTLASTLAPKGTMLLICIGLGVAALFVGIGWATGFYRDSNALALLLSLLFSAWWLHFLLKKSAWHAWHKVLIDALMLFQCCLVLLLR